MASIHKAQNSPYYYCAFYLPNGRRAFRSTGTSSRRKALGICLKYEETSRLAKEGRLTDKRARETIADIYHIANAEKMPTSTVNQFLESWLLKKSLEVADSSYQEYERAVTSLKAFLKGKCELPLDAITSKEIGGYRGSLAAKLSGGSVNKYLKILRGAWTQALRDKVARENIFDHIDLIRVENMESRKRRAFTFDELKQVIKACGDSEWRGVVLMGLYTGQRLSDCATIHWQNIDLAEEEIRLQTQKTGRRMALPIAPPLLKYLMGKAGDDPAAFVFPELAKYCGQNRSTLSRQFSEILGNVGLAEKKTHDKAKGGRGIRRDTSALSFHCLRHTATSLLKNAGVSDVVAREIIGHDSEAISRAYTHIEKGTLKKAISMLPNVMA